MFTVTFRSDLRDQLVEDARADQKITAAAIVGSGALDREDEWSDIDLAMRLAVGAEPLEVAEPWTARIHEAHGAAHHFDIWAGDTLFRVFLLSNSLQVDLSFWPADRFAASGDSFRLLFGEANLEAAPSKPEAESVVGMAWLYALHARSSIARERSWQSLHMLNGIREEVIVLACLRHGLPAREGRGVDDLSTKILDTLSGTLVDDLSSVELVRAFGAATDLLLREAAHVDPELAAQLSAPLRELVRTSRPAS